MTRTRARVIPAVVLAVAALAALVAVAWGGGPDESANLRWSGTPQVWRSGAATDRVMSAKVENTSLRDVFIDSENVRVLDANGDAVRSTARFLASFMHGRYPWNLRGDEASALGADERARMGEVVKLKPGQTAPLTLSWRMARGGSAPVRVDFGSATLNLPR